MIHRENQRVDKLQNKVSQLQKELKSKEQQQNNKSKKITNGDIEISEIINLKDDLIGKGIEKIREAQKSRDIFLRDNMNKINSLPTHCPSLDEIYNIKFDDFVSEIKKFSYSSENIKENNCEEERIKYYHQMYNEISKELKENNLRNSDNSQKILYKLNQFLRKDEEKNKFNRKEIEYQISNKIFNNPREEFVNSVFEFISEMVHEHKIQYHKKSHI